MSSPEAVSVTKPSLAQDWLRALQYWLRGRRGAAVLAGSVVVIGAAANWSWLVAVGIAPLLLTALPCVAVCGLGLCMSKTTGGSCSSASSGAASMPEPDGGQRLAASVPAEDARVSPTPEAGPLPVAPSHGSPGQDARIQTKGR